MKHIWLVLALLMLAGSTLAAEEAKPVRIEGTNIEMVPPTGFEKATTFPGFQHNTLGASIMVTVMAAPADDVIKGFTKDALAQKGMTLLGTQDLDFGPTKGKGYYVTQVHNGQTYHKVMGIFGTEKQTNTIVGTLPEAQASMENLKMLLAGIQTARMVGVAPSDPFEGLTFTVKQVSPLTHTNHGKIANSILFSSSATSEGPTKDSYLLIGMSLGAVKVPDVAAFSKKRLTQYPYFAQVTITQEAPVSIDGLNGYRVIGMARDVEAGNMLYLYQVVLVDPVKGYYVFLGVSPETPTPNPEARKAIAAMTESFKRKPVPAPKP